MLALASCARPADKTQPAQTNGQPASFDAAVREQPKPTVVPEEEKPVLEQAIQLQLPNGLSADVYERVRKDPILGAALDGEMIPALERAGSPADRLAAFDRARGAVLATWTPTASPEEAASKATGPMVPAGRAAFDQVSTDVLRAWFIQVSEAVSAAGPRDAALAAIQDLEARANAAFSWDAGAAQSVAVRVRLVRAQLEQAAP